MGIDSVSISFRQVLTLTFSCSMASVFSSLPNLSVYEHRRRIPALLSGDPMTKSFFPPSVSFFFFIERSGATSPRLRAGHDMSKSPSVRVGLPIPQAPHLPELKRMALGLAPDTRNSATSALSTIEAPAWRCLFGPESPKVLACHVPVSGRRGHCRTGFGRLHRWLAWRQQAHPSLVTRTALRRIFFCPTGFKEKRPESCRLLSLPHWCLS